jgi:CheY-like chemotaxis protein
VAGNGIDGLHMATEGSHDLIVLDTMLPGIDGLGLLAALRQSKQTPVIMLTARHRVEDRVRGLKSRRGRLSRQAVRLLRTGGPHRGTAAPRRRRRAGA